MNNSGYLNEENFQKSNKKIKTVGLIILIIGLVAMIGGIVFLVSAAQIDVPQMGDDNWFEVRKLQSGRRTAGILMLIPGIFVAIVGCVVRFFIGNQRQIMGYMAQQQMPIAQEGIEKMAPSVGKAAGTIAKEVKKSLEDEKEDV